ncbi:MAG: hypothetical protein JWM91_3346, partial [Rhodospirillales bacterium]|nr:hypothetical protein [Rhodospirillales bacterium]
MTSATETKTFADSLEGALHLRIHQQEILAELGMLALHGTPSPELIER